MSTELGRWDIFCRVVDNFGDIGVCWRLAKQLADEHGVDVRLWIDNLDSFSRFCPSALPGTPIQRIEGIDVCHWPAKFPDVDSADVVIEAFACELPEAYVTAMNRKTVAPVWVNLEYLTAEAWVEDCHLLTSPQARSSLKKYFYFPGFTSKTGGLIRERGLLDVRAAFDRSAAEKFWHSLGIPPAADNEMRVSLFCYENAALPKLLENWSIGPTPVRVLATPGSATEQIARWFSDTPLLGMALQKGSLTVNLLPFLSQGDYDRLLWACDVNFVRGEDSFVRAQWAQKPFVWHIYPQLENAHQLKLEAFLARYLNESEDSDVIRRCWYAWNGVGEIGSAWSDFTVNRFSIEKYGKVWARQLDRESDLANNLVSFVSGE